MCGIENNFNGIMLTFFLTTMFWAMVFFILMYKFIHSPDYTYTDEPRFPKIPEEQKEQKQQYDQL